MNYIFLSVDADEWYLARWATGSKKSVWPDLNLFYRDVYNQNCSIGEMRKPFLTILDLFKDLDFKSTFFFTGIMASTYPDLVELAAKHGHEIACHNYYHIDYEPASRAQFIDDLLSSKELLENLCNQNVIGYRSPNSSIPATLVEDLSQSGFKYDSSVTPTRRLFGKFGNFTKAPRRPYRASASDISVEDSLSDLWEFPWASIPVLNLPAGSGIMHRIAGNLYNFLATELSLLYGSTSYYFHPYEIECSPYMKKYSNTSFKTRIFTRNIGPFYYKQLQSFIFNNRAKLINGKNLVKKLTEN